MVKNKAPLQENEFYPLPLGQIKPRGWLKDQLRIQAEGMTGLLPDYWEPLSGSEFLKLRTRCGTTILRFYISLLITI